MTRYQPKQIRDYIEHYFPGGVFPEPQVWGSSQLDQARTIVDMLDGLDQDMLGRRLGTDRARFHEAYSALRNFIDQSNRQSLHDRKMMGDSRLNTQRIKQIYELLERCTEEGEQPAAGVRTGADAGGEPARFMRRLEAEAPNASEVVLAFAREAVKTFEAECYLASAVMLGAAAESLLLEVAGAFVSWLQTRDPDRADGLLKSLAGRTTFGPKLKTFRDAFRAHVRDLPDDITREIEIDLDGAAQLFRITRNDAGHPTGATISHDQQYTHLTTFMRYIARFEGLRRFLEEDTATC